MLFKPELNEGAKAAGRSVIRSVLRRGVSLLITALILGGLGYIGWLAWQQKAAPRNPNARPDLPVTYTARAGAIVTVDGAPAIVLRDGQVQRQLRDGTVNVLDFDRYVLQLGRMTDEPDQFYLKASDRTLNQLFFPDKTAHYDQRNVNQFQAEGHARLSSPLLNTALAMIALSGVLVGEFSRQRRSQFVGGRAVGCSIQRGRNAITLFNGDQMISARAPIDP